jgi:hypothetical protein
VIFKFVFELFIVHVPSCFNCLFFNFLFISDFYFINNISCTSIFSLQISISDIKNDSILTCLSVERIIDMRNNLLLLDLFNQLFYLLGKSKSMVLLTLLVINLVNIIVCASFSILLSNPKNFSVAVSDMLNKVSTITNKSALNGINNRASTFIKTE